MNRTAAAKATISAKNGDIGGQWAWAEKGVTLDTSTDKPCRAGELIERKQSKRIAHDDAHASTSSPLVSGMAQPAEYHRKRRKAEVGLGLATARWEEQQVHRCAIGVARVGKTREIQQ